MAPPPPTTTPKAAQPALFAHTFDAWNSSSTGHQTAPNRLSSSTAWRDSRTLKLAHQLRDGQRGGKRLADTVGAGSEGFGKDGRLENGGFVRGASALRGRGQMSLWDCVGEKKVSKNGVMREKNRDVVDELALGSRKTAISQSEKDAVSPSKQPRASASPPSAQVPPQSQPPTSRQRAPQIFAHLTVQVNGSTYPFISDHKLKRLLVSHGATMSLHLARRSVTHVILGHASSHSRTIGGGGGAGGGLAGGKREREIASVRGKKVKFVSAEWVVESVKAGRRLSEAPFEVGCVKRQGQRGVGEMIAAGSER